MSTTPEERRARAQAAAQSSWARTTDRRARVQPAIDARKAALDRRLAEKFNIPLDGSPESEQRLDAARRAHYANLNRLSLKSRRLKAEERQRLAEEAEAERRAAAHARIAAASPLEEDDLEDLDPDDLEGGE